MKRYTRIILGLAAPITFACYHPSGHEPKRTKGGELLMDNGKIIAAIDEQIGRLQQARQLLGGASPAQSRRKAGKRKPMSAAGRKRISIAQKKRWATVKTKQKAA
jgi:hypothetical protein